MCFILCPFSKHNNNNQLKINQFKARGRTNAELREEFILAAGVSQTMQAFTPRHSVTSATGSPMKVNFCDFVFLCSILITKPTNQLQ